MNIRLKEMREQKGMTQEELAEKSGVCRATISAIENQNSECIKTVTLVKLADALEVPVKVLFF